MRNKPRVFLALGLGLALGGAVATSPLATADAHGRAWQFERIGTFIVCENSSCDAGVVEETVAEIVAASDDARTLIYTDSPQQAIGLVDISDPARPKGLGIVKVGGEPTSVDVAGRYALVAVNTSSSFVQPSGHLAVFDLHACRADVAGCAPLATLDLGGQPDSVAVSPDRRYAAVVVENERDEDFNDGEIPQLPAGFLSVIELKGPPTSWTAQPVDLTGRAAIAPTDPEPEFVKINRFNVAAVTLQENNHIVLVHLPTRRVVHSFSAGSVSLDAIDIEEDGVINATGALADLKREPDAIAWLGDARLVTANEGDLEGGSRGFTIFGAHGRVLFDAGNAFDHLAIKHGHYPEGRSENKGSEPEGVAVGTYRGDDYIFVGSERANFVAVYRSRGFAKPEFVQILPTGIGPEGLLAIPQRNLFVASTEVDEGQRAQINIFRLQPGPATYPNIVSSAARDGSHLTPRPAFRGDSRNDAAPIGWGALSALAADRHDADTLYTVHDSAYQRSRIYTVDVSRTPAVITAAMELRKNGGPANYDLEGLAQREHGGFWAVSEGAGNAPNATTRNLLVEIADDGTVMREIELPAAVNALQTSSGFEGVTVVGAGPTERVYVAFQREWKNDPKGFVRIGEYRPTEDAWRFFYYPLDAVASPAGGWVGLSEITALGDDRFAVIERDNQGGSDARIKRIYTFSIAGLVPQAQGAAAPFPVVTKHLAVDVLPLMQARNGWVLDKLEGFAVAKDGAAFAVTDNDGVDDSSGETQLFRLGRFGR